MIVIDKINKAFGDNDLYNDFSLEINMGEIIAFTGPSGCGKTTLLNMIGGLEKIDSGKILVDEEDIGLRKNQLGFFRTKVGFLFQNFALVENKTVRENLEIIKPKFRTEISVEKALEAVGMNGKEDRKIYSLSGGEQQRVALARLMIKQCDYILADEPTGSLDKANAQAVIDILKSIQKSQGRTIIIVTHDMSIAQQCDRTIAL